jgi:hypothetical protein
MRRMSCVLFLLLFISPIYADDKVVKEILDISVSITNQNSEVLGSGTIFFDKTTKKYVVLTCGHLFPTMRKVEELDIEDKDGIVKKIKKVVWANPKIYQSLYKNGKETQRIFYNTKMIKYSPSEEEGGIDLAVLEIMDSSFVRQSGNFIMDDNLIFPGVDVIHAGSLYGMSTAITKGYFSKLDEPYRGQPFNIAILHGRGGSSGGGVFIDIKGKNTFCGIVVRGDSAGLMMLKTPDTIRTWLKKEKIDILP